MKLIGFLVAALAVAVLVAQVSEGKPSWKKPNKHDNGRRRRPLQDKKIRNYLKKFYRVRGRWSSPQIPSVSNFRETLMEFQGLAHLRQTGEFNEPTARAMSWPRCGVYDTIAIDVDVEGERMKRYVLSGSRYKWDVRDLTYMIMNYPDEGISTITHSEVDEAVAAAFKLWSDVTTLTFTRVPPSGEADIVLSFGKRVHSDVPDDPPFDGPGGDAAHSYRPNSGWGSLNGDLHYDDEETFTHKKYYGINLFYLTAHELGHALGLEHSDVVGALMSPFIRSYRPDYRLPEDDIQGIQAIYGANPSPPVSGPQTPTLPPQTTPGSVPPYCDLTFDEVAIIRGEMFVFHGKTVWRFSADGHRISSEDGETIRSIFTTLPSVVHAIVERWFDEKVLFIKGGAIWTASGRDYDETSMAALSELGLPKSLNAAMHRASEGITYFFKEKVVYKYDEFGEVMTSDSPMKTHRAFRGIPRATRVTSAFTGIDGYHYLLVGKEYYKVNPDLQSDGTPYNFSQDFLRCPRV